MFDPDLITGKLIGKTFVSKLYLFDEIESTNDFAKINQIPNDSLIITNYQIKGRGRFERKWESEKGKNLTFTIFKKFDIEPKDQVNLNYCTAFSIFNELKAYLQQFDNKDISSNLHIKWPNDITLNNKKIAGILIETKQGSKEFIIGAGINVNQDSFTTGNATSLFNETRKPVNINKFLINIVISLHKNFELIFSHKYLELYGLWKRNLSLIREKVTFLAPNGQKREGIVLDFLSNGQILMNIDGRETLYNSGEIKLQI